MDIAIERISALNGDTTLNLSYLQLTSLPPLPPTLRFLECSNNMLTCLPPLPPTLKFLDCSNNMLTQLPPLIFEGQSALKYLDCSNNTLTSLPLLPPTLIRLFCSDNPFTEYLPFEITHTNSVDHIRKWMEENSNIYVKSANKV